MSSEMNGSKMTEMARDSTLTRENQITIPSTLTTMDGEKAGTSTQSSPTMNDDINKQIIELQKEQELQKQKLWYAFQEQNRQLELQHKLQLEHKLQELQQRLAEEKQQREKREQESLRRKEKQENCSANASLEVKQKLQNFIMKKQAANGLSGSTNSMSSYRNLGVIKSSSGESLPYSGVAAPHPYKIPPPQVVKYDPDYPLRKTASEPNLMKNRLRQKLIDHKNRARKYERLNKIDRRLLKHHSQTIVTANSIDSSPNSPPSIASRTSPSSATITEENETPSYGTETRANINDLSLFSSPSMPNISLGRSHLFNPHNLNQYAMLATMHSSSTHSMQQAQFLSPLDLTDPRHRPPTNTMVLPSPTQLSGPSAAALAAAVSSAAAAHAINRPSMSMYGQPITDSQVAHARLLRRPLGRTKSSPLPLGHPMLTGNVPLNISPTHYEDSEAERQAAYEQMFVRQHSRPSIFSRTNSNQTLPEEESLEAIDLTDKRDESKGASAMDSTETLPDDERRLREQEYLQQQRELLLRNSSMTIPPEHEHNSIRPLSRTLSSPMVGPLPPLSHSHTLKSPDDTSISLGATALSITGQKLVLPEVKKPTTGLAYDNLMLKHACICGNNSSHPEHSGRLQSIWARLGETGLAARCDRLRSRKATQEDLQSVHTEAHSMLFGASQINKQKLEASRVTFVRLGCGGVGVDLDTTWNEHHTASAARMAVGCVVDLALKTARGDVKNGFAVVRPPGHHAEPNAAMGFCFFNSVAIAARLLKQQMPDIKRVLIVDWDVHHGNGTQQIFYDDPDVLYLSIHRHDDGNFFPGTGGPTECGTGPGLGFNVNIAWSGGLSPPLGDAEYLAAFRTIVLPIAKDFAPDIVLVSAGFDAAAGHPPPLGGYVVSPSCFGHLTKQLMQLANGKIILALEGGYDLPAICDSAEECVKALLGIDPSPIDELELKRPPCLPALETLQKTIAIQMAYWPCLKTLAHTVTLSCLEAQTSEKDETETVSAMAGLSMQPPDRTTKLSTEEPMDEDESK